MQVVSVQYLHENAIRRELHYAHVSAIGFDLVVKGLYCHDVETGWRHNDVAMLLPTVETFNCCM